MKMVVNTHTRTHLLLIIHFEIDEIDMLIPFQFDAMRYHSNITLWQKWVEKWGEGKRNKIYTCWLKYSKYFNAHLYFCRVLLQCVHTSVSSDFFSDDWNAIDCYFSSINFTWYIVYIRYIRNYWIVWRCHSYIGLMIWLTCSSHWKYRQIKIEPPHHQPQQKRQNQKQPIDKSTINLLITASTKSKSTRTPQLH